MESNSHNIVQRNVKLSRDDIEWYDEHYPHASLSGILGLLLSRFRMLHNTSPVMLVEQAAKDVKEGLE